MSSLPYIIAVDFDGTLVSDKFPEIGEPDEWLFKKVQVWKKAGAKIVLWTCRHNTRLMEAVAFCRERGLTFDAVNSNIPEVQELYGHDTRKVYADIYIDDKGHQWDMYPTQRIGKLVDEIAFRNYNNQ